jgi:cation diffusion facilitator CzcD-associated flavoprotein CzcO
VSAAPSATGTRPDEADRASEDGQHDLPRHVEVALVGAGFGGLGAAISLERAGFRDFVVLERGAEVGGTWWFNSYPGAQCDIPSNLYSFSFAPKPDWTTNYPLQPEILDYLRECSRSFAVRDRIRFECELLEATWREEEQRWEIETSAGSLTARMLVAAPGLLSEPRTPDLPGLDSFAGPVFHSARWDHSQDLRGKRVALVGTGASAIQIGPRIQPEVERMYVFQRTPPWVVPLPDRPVGERLQRLYRRFPMLQKASRGFDYALREPIVIAMAFVKPLLKLGEALSRYHLRRQVPDPELRRRLTPDYVLGCKRLLLSSDWYPALAEPNVEVVTEGVEEVRERGVVASDGVEREVDAIVFATGFTPTEPPIARRLRGSDGRTLAEAWEGAPEAYLGTTVAGFPNLFLIYGPNTNLGHNSIVYMLESQYEYLLRALRAMRERGLGRLEVREDVQRSFNERVQKRLKGTVWNAGRCASWYLDENGENPIMWSDFTFRFRRLARGFDLGEHHVAARVEDGARGEPAAWAEGGPATVG